MKEFTPSQRQTFQATAELYQDYLEAARQLLTLKGGMHWKQIRGRKYLYRYRDRFGHGESLGPESETTRGLYAEFTQQRQAAGARLQAQRLRLKEQARFCRAAAINLVPEAAGTILRRLEQDEARRHLLVVGTAALYAYEFAAGVFLEEAASPGFPKDAGRGLTFSGDTPISPDGLLPLLRRADRSFTLLEAEGCRAANRDGYLVQVLNTGFRRPGKPKAITVPGGREPLPPDAGNLQFLWASPKLSQVVIGRDGWPATMTVPDPRAFALRRLWLSQQEDRGPAVRQRDLNQALALAVLVVRYLPQYDFSPSELDMFPRDLLEVEGMG